MFPTVRPAPVYAQGDNNRDTDDQLLPNSETGKEEDLAQQ